MQFREDNNLLVWFLHCVHLFTKWKGPFETEICVFDDCTQELFLFLVLQSSPYIVQFYTIEMKSINQSLLIHFYLLKSLLFISDCAVFFVIKVMQVNCISTNQKEVLMISYFLYHSWMKFLCDTHTKLVLLGKFKLRDSICVYKVVFVKTILWVNEVLSKATLRSPKNVVVFSQRRLNAF